MSVLLSSFTAVMFGREGKGGKQELVESLLRVLSGTRWWWHKGLGMPGSSKETAGPGVQAVRGVRGVYGSELSSCSL